MADQRGELLERQALPGTGQGPGRIWVDLDEQAMRTRGARGPGHRRDVAPQARAVAGVDDDRQVRPRADAAPRREVGGVAGAAREGPDPPFEEDPLLVPPPGPVPGGGEPF